MEYVSDRLLRDLDSLKGLVRELGMEPSDISDLLKIRSLIVGNDVINTRLTADEVLVISAIDAINDANGDNDVSYDCPIIRGFTYQMKLNYVSLDGEGRKELVTISIPEKQKTKTEQLIEGLRGMAK